MSPGPDVHGLTPSEALDAKRKIADAVRTVERVVLVDCPRCGGPTQATYLDAPDSVDGSWVFRPYCVRSAGQSDASGHALSNEWTPAEQVAMEEQARFRWRIVR